MTGTIFLTLLVSSSVSSQSNSRLIGTYESVEISFEKSSIMILEENYRFIYKFRNEGCQGEIQGTWKAEDWKITFKNDPKFLDNPNTFYPDLALVKWTASMTEITPEGSVGIGCSSIEMIHKRKGWMKFHEYQVSLIQLIASPERYYQRRVQVIGFINLQFEGQELYLHKEDYKSRISKNALWVSFSEQIDFDQLKKVNKGYVLVEGRFDMNRHGHMGASSGEIKNITRIVKWY